MPEDKEQTQYEIWEQQARQLLGAAPPIQSDINAIPGNDLPAGAPVQVRLVGPPEAVAAVQSLLDRHFYLHSRRKAACRSGLRRAQPSGSGCVRVYSTLQIPGEKTDES